MGEGFLCKTLDQMVSGLKKWLESLCFKFKGITELRVPFATLGYKRVLENC